MSQILTLPNAAPGDGETLSDQIFKKIQAAIVKGEMAPGSKISEPELARIHGVSRGPLREALHRLEGQRLLVRVPHAGARVVSLSQQELCELYEIRESLEGMACRLAAERMPAAEVQELRRVLEAHERDKAFRRAWATTSRRATTTSTTASSGQRQPDAVRMLCDELYQLARMYRIQYSTTPNRPGDPLPNTTAFSTPLPTAMASWLNS